MVPDICSKSYPLIGVSFLTRILGIEERIGGCATPHGN
jgi:hypothetical protein